MKAKQLHSEAMQYSQLAKDSFEKGEDLQAQDYYTRAAEIETDLARFYFDKPELEPTRATIVRSAVYLNLKAGLIEKAQNLIFWGMLNLPDAGIKVQLQEALEVSVALKNVIPAEAGGNLEYLRLLRQRSVHYTIENVLPKFGTAVTFDMIQDFAGNYLKSLRAYAVTVFKEAALGIEGLSNDIDAAARHFEELVNPLITNAAFGSFKFSIANDFLSRGETGEVARLKATVLQQYHDRIFTNPLDDEEIVLLKAKYKEEEISQIFRPLTNIKSADSPYKVAYYDRETFSKVYVPRIINDQKRKLLPTQPSTIEEIGILESSIYQVRGGGRKKSRSMVQKETLKTAKLEHRTRQIEPKDRVSLMLNREILIDVLFDSGKGFTFHYEGLGIENTEAEFGKGLTNFYTLFYEKILEIVNANPTADSSDAQIKLVGELINDPGKLKK